MKKVRLIIYAITVVLVYWSIYCNNQFNGLNIYKLSIEQGSFIVNTYKYFYLASFLFLIVSLKFIADDIKGVRLKLSEKTEIIKAKFKADKNNKKQKNKDEKSIASNVPLEQLITCTKCGYSNKVTSKFCQKCGEKIEVVIGEAK